MLGTIRIRIYLNNLLKREKSIAKDLTTDRYGAVVLGFHPMPFTEIWPLSISLKKQKKLLAHFTHAVKKSTKTYYIFTARYEHFTTGQEIDKEVVDGLFHEKEVGNKHLDTFLLEKVEDEKILWNFLQSKPNNCKREEKSF